LIFSRAKFNTYNILKIAGSSLGYKHTEETIAKMSGKNHSRGTLGKFHSTGTLALMSIAKIGKNNPMIDKTHSNTQKKLKL